VPPHRGLHGNVLVVNASPHEGSVEREASAFAAHAAANAPRNHRPIEGHYDRTRQRVDVATGKIVER
jgi:hypothetical protein